MLSEMLTLPLTWAGASYTVVLIASSGRGGSRSEPGEPHEIEVQTVTTHTTFGGVAYDIAWTLTAIENMADEFRDAIEVAVGEYYAAEYAADAAAYAAGLE